MTWEKTLHDLRAELETHEGYPCVTLTMPTGRSMPANAEDPIRLKNLVTEASNRLTEELGKRPAQAALANLQKAAESVDHDKNMDGLAIFANETVEIVLKTRFPLHEKLTIDDRFSLRPIMRAERRAEPYSVLVLSLQDAKLFEGCREDLYEVRGHGFPAENKGAGGASKVPGGPGVNRTAAVDDSRSRFVRECLDKVAAIPGQPAQIIVTGTEEILSAMAEQIPATLDLMATLAGNYTLENPAALGKKAFEALRDARRIHAQDLLDRLDKARSAQRWESGVQAIAPLALDGRVELLVCGFDHEAPGRFDESTRSMVLIERPHDWKDSDDAVEWIVQRVLQSGGTVRFIEDDLLGDNPIQAVLRY
jgi:peptide subunit release factor 1 (eRF1)